MRHRRLLPFAIVLLLVHAGLAPAQNDPVEKKILAPLGSSPHLIRLHSGPHVVTSQASVEDLNFLDRLPGLPTIGKISFRQFMLQVEQSNLDLAAQRFNVPIAQAQLLAARIYPDPEFEAGYGGDVSGQRQASTYVGGFSQTLLLGGKIGARTDAANANLQANQAGLNDFLRNLRAQAANSYIDALTDLLMLQRKIKQLQRAEQLVDLNTRRMEAREISEDQVMRVRINEVEARGEVISSESLLHQELVSMGAFTGQQSRGGLIAPAGNLEMPQRHFSLEELVTDAVSFRSDVVYAAHSLDNAKAEYRLAKANRVPDLTAAGVYAHMTRITNPIDPAPAWDSLGLSLSIPIPRSNLNQGPLQAAYYSQMQAERELEAARLRAATEVRSAYERYALSVIAVRQYAAEMLQDADQIYKARLFRLGQNTTTLIDVLDAHRALNHLYFDYYSALNEQARALVNLEQSAGIWDIAF